ncbi:M23 family metallopeptidase [Paracoccus luteus]|uniref:M23 family metallopeptidase n=1 Tax=Paracoccus luteus TaxID=2508543 RepID=UPI00106F7CE7|nr:M23 family metallopeptidase [Paracoccus luteus]
MVTRVLLRAGSCTLIVALAGCVQPTGGAPGAAPGQPGTVAQGPAASTPLAMSRMQLPQVRIPQMPGQPAAGAQAQGTAAPGSRMAMPRFTLPWGRPAAAGAAPGQVTDPFAGQGVRQPAVEGGLPARSSGAAAQAATQSHTVAAGETAWSIARRYGVSADALAQANALPASMAVRVGQRLAIPARAGTTTVAVAAPGAGSATPQPPSASRPLPSERTRPASTPAPRADAPDMGQTRTAASGSGRFAMPVNGSIVRPYKKGTNEGIDISAAPGAAVRAASAGTVAAVTRDTDGVPIVVVRHDGGLMTVYAGIDGLKVAKGDSVSAGQSIGTARNEGVVHFEVRKGFDSVDPEGYL